MSSLLREISDSEIEPVILAHLKRVASQAGCRFTVFEGIVAARIYMAIHAGPSVSLQFLQTTEAEEFAALPAASGAQN